MISWYQDMTIVYLKLILLGFKTLLKLKSAAMPPGVTPPYLFI